jgi:hypothetical protein
MRCLLILILLACILATGCRHTQTQVCATYQSGPNSLSIVHTIR